MYRNVRFGGVSQILNCLPPLAVPTPQHKELVRKFGVNIATPTTDGPIPVQKYKNLRTCTVLYYFHLVVAIPHITGSQGEIFCVQKASDGNCGIFSFRPDMLHFGDSTFMLQVVLFRKQSKQLCSSSILLRTCSINKNFIQTDSYLWWIVETTQLKDHSPSFRSKNPPNNCWNQHLHVHERSIIK